MTQLGFEADMLVKFEHAIHKPWGMVLVTGPTGSGKTNTLYSALSQLNQPGVNIMTAEDPVEFNLMGINQVQVKEQIGLTFASALRLSAPGPEHHPGRRSVTAKRRPSR
jgi:type IV pilus assembly protein PilB